MPLDGAYAIEERGLANRHDPLPGDPFSAIGIQYGYVAVAGDADQFALDTLIIVEREGAIGECKEPNDNLKNGLGKEDVVAEHRRYLHQIAGLLAVDALPGQIQID